MNLFRVVINLDSLPDIPHKVFDDMKRLFGGTQELFEEVLACANVMLYTEAGIDDLKRLVDCNAEGYCLSTIDAYLDILEEDGHGEQAAYFNDCVYTTISSHMSFLVKDVFWSLFQSFNESINLSETTFQIADIVSTRFSSEHPTLIVDLEILNLSEPNHEPTVSYRKIKGLRRGSTRLGSQPNRSISLLDRRGRYQGISASGYR